MKKVTLSSFNWWIPISKDIKIPDDMKFSERELRPFLRVMRKEEADLMWSKLIAKKLKRESINPKR